jgi:ATP-dependent Lhr-like helicase
LRLDPEVAAPASGALDAETPESALAELVRGRLEGVGATTVAALASSLGIEAARIDVALGALESEGFVLRGHFTPGRSEVEWCERRLLARMHRYTLKRLRAEIEPVAPADFMRFLLDWQHVTSSERLSGPNAVAAVLEQLEGFAAPAIAWEDDLLAARIADYDPSWLDAQCQSGRFVWARIGPPRPIPVAGAASLVRAPGPVRSTPIGFLQRRNVPRWDGLLDPTRADELRLSPAAQAVDAALERHGAAFFDDLAAETGLLRTQIEAALAELVAAGRLHSDSFIGLRALLVPASERRPLAGAARRRRRGPRYEITDAGRWVLRRRAVATPEDDREAIETLARVYLRRYGVVCRRLLEREAVVPPWRDLLRTYHRMEARGEIRGGRFVAGFAGEQFALPEAVGKLREVRRTPAAGTIVSLSAADPLNLAGIVTPDARLPALAGNRILYRDGSAIAVREAGEVRVLVPLDAAADWRVRQALVRRIGAPARPEGRRAATR